MKGVSGREYRGVDRGKHIRHYGTHWQSHYGGDNKYIKTGAGQQTVRNKSAGGGWTVGNGQRPSGQMISGKGGVGQGQGIGWGLVHQGRLRQKT